MTVQELNAELYEKMWEEQEAFKGWLVSQPPGRILCNAYEYTVREDLLLALEENNLTEEQVRALLNRETPLKDLYLVWAAKETSYMEQLWETIVEQAKRYSEEQRETAATRDKES